MVFSGCVALAQTANIGNQLWMTKNLDVTTFRNGDTITEVRKEEEWKKLSEEGKPAWCYYDNDPLNGEKYGKLYNWFAVNDPRGLAPEGWHIPTDAEWTVLSDFLGGEEKACAKMKSTSGWKEFNTPYAGNVSGNGNNYSGFSGFPGGARIVEGNIDLDCKCVIPAFGLIGEEGYWWSSTELESGIAWNRSLNFMYSMYRMPGSKGDGLSVRCIKDSEPEK